MEFALASQGTNNAYFDRIVQNQVDNDLHGLAYCLQKCNLAFRAHLKPGMSLEQRLCLSTDGVMKRIARRLSVWIWGRRRRGGDDLK